jgi:hypothetical protein
MEGYQMKRLFSGFLFGYGVLALGLVANAQSWGQNRIIRPGGIRIIETVAAIPMIATRSREHIGTDETNNF